MKYFFEVLGRFVNRPISEVLEDIAGPVVLVIFLLVMLGMPGW
jgi:hypothetical protein